MADTREFPTLDAEAAPVGFTPLHLSVWGTLDAAAAPVAMAGLTLATATVSSGSHFHSALPGRFRTVEG